MLKHKAICTAPNVFHCKENIKIISENEIQEIKDLSKLINNTTRICLHPSVEDKVHISVICTSREFENRKHFHPKKCEFIIPIQGKAELNFFGEGTEIVSSILLEGEKTNIVKVPQGAIHNFSVKTDIFVFWEICEGPFSSNSTIYLE